MRDIKVRVDVLRNNVKVTELAALSTPSIQSDANSEIKTSLTGNFKQNDVIDWLTDELMPVVTIDGTDYPFGVFAPTTYTFSTDGIIDSVSVEAYDRCWWLKVKCTDTILHLASGTNYITQITSLLTQCGIGFVISYPTTYTLATDREDWDIGTDYLTIVNTLLEEINYNAIWFNSQGYAILSPKSTLSGNPVRSYDFHNSKLLHADIEITADLFNAPNVFLCICDNPDHDVWTATAKNESSKSPLSTTRRGREIMSCIKVDNIASASALQEYASYVCYKSMLLSQEIRLVTDIMPNCGINDLVSVVHASYDGLCREIGWSVELASGAEMEHILETETLMFGTTSSTTSVTSGTIAGIAIVGVNIVGVA